MDEKLKVIKEAILEVAKKHGVEIEKIILFGSRVRGESKEDSDWDLLIVTKKRLDKRVKDRFVLEVRREIVWRLDEPVDIIVTDRRKYEEYEHVYGSVIGQAANEGVTI